jgi:hypothetical protein
MAEKYSLMIPAFEKVPAISRVMPYQKNEGDTDPQDEIEAATTKFNEQYIFSKKLQTSGYEEGHVVMVRQVMDAAVLGLDYFGYFLGNTRKYSILFFAKYQYIYFVS